MLREEPENGETPLLLHIPLQLLHLRLDDQVNRFMGCDCHIEIFFRVLKQGCQVETLRLATASRLENAVAVYLIIAWRLHLLTMLSRAHPLLPADVVFTRTEWETIYLMDTTQLPPPVPPPLRTITRQLAHLGGFLRRKGDREPGIQSLWIGYQRLLAFLHARQVLQEVALMCV